MKKILIIIGHPVKDTFSDLLRTSYLKGATESGAEIRQILLRKLSFDLNFSEGYRGNQQLEPDLQKAQEDILWADHLVIIYPNWWSTFPALLKGFIDRTFLPGFAFRYRKGSLLWDKLLTGKTARLIITMDTPPWYYWLVYRRPGHNAMKRGILEFCGIRPVRITTLGPVKLSSEKKRANWLRKVESLGRKQN
ncbi:MAG: NAD(P)H-dependent oxidoreductase [Lentimicrobiaceae bacterium]|nr:NAD(P)H-dependent oxidoreductase [Lentimicrobiaceae bacterium]MCB9023230.1 NAD(P)H-dependent oxidoreductase [Lentimicrobiaceae bacterium]MCO5266495.1 NAD(P)H-dependent oxidoreductase [Lentimicrobium sp.]HPG33874.1 NAD(P)H-dependent oxidoreductase [Lentimicrobium sp.]